jgi:hypothetical protein
VLLCGLLLLGLEGFVEHRHHVARQDLSDKTLNVDLGEGACVRGQHGRLAEPFGVRAVLLGKAVTRHFGKKHEQIAHAEVDAGTDELIVESTGVASGLKHGAKDVLADAAQDDGAGLRFGGKHESFAILLGHVVEDGGRFDFVNEGLEQAGIGFHSGQHVGLKFFVGALAKAPLVVAGNFIRGVSHDTLL